MLYGTAYKFLTLIVYLQNNSLTLDRLDTGKQVLWQCKLRYNAASDKNNLQGQKYIKI